MINRIKAVLSDARGIATEYVLLIVVIALAIIAGMGILATNLNQAFQDAGDEVEVQTTIP